MADNKEEAARITKEVGVTQRKLLDLLEKNDFKIDNITCLAMFMTSISMMLTVFGPLHLARAASLLINLWRKAEVKIALETLVDKKIIVLEENDLADEDDTIH